MDKDKNEQYQRQDGPGGPVLSLRLIMGVLFFLLMTGTVLLSLLINSVFLERYYISDRKHTLVRMYKELQKASEAELLESDDYDLSMQEGLQRSNVSLLIMDSSTRTVKSWSADSAQMEERLYASIFGLTPVLDGDAAMTEGAASEAEEDGLSEREDSGRDRQKDGTGAYDAGFVITQVLEEDQNYTIHVVLNQRTQTRSIEMWGLLGQGSFFMLRSPLEDITRSAGVANRFFGYISMLLAAAGAVLAWWLSRRITNPVRQLTDLSRRMKELDFSAKYEGGNRTELDTLGRNMNELSQKLEETISALRTANNDLQRDLDRRNREEEMRQDFLSSVTHELKTPIALIRGYAEGLQDGIADDAESRSFYLDTIVEESDRMNLIVQKVLQLNQLEFGDGSVSMERFDIVDMISNYLESASLLARQEGVTLLFRQDEPVYVWGDPFLIQEVIQNYYSNALHHVEPRPEQAEKGRAPEKIIDLRCEEKGQVVRVTVFNTGRPIPEASLPHIWEKFYKVDKARTRAYGGSGVGLSIVKAIMDLHHRGYGADNYENGVAFWFELDVSGESS